ncbi:MAG: NUDIX domain-containing protein [Parcubacteria group bacterium]|nr:NUDIX domain-containing protein [Parcubacteria group bacterium]
MRVVGIIIKDSKVLLMHRKRHGDDFYVFPGGRLEDDETVEQALVREMKEEVSLDIINFKKLFQLKNQLKDEYGGYYPGYSEEEYFLIESFLGDPVLGGPEKEKMNDQNQYYLEWTDLSKINQIESLYPKEAINKLLEYLQR